MGRQKILYVITKSVWGGAQKYVYDLATNLPKDHFEVAVVIGGLGPLAEKLEKARIQTFVLPPLQESNALLAVLFSFINIRALWKLIRIFQKERPDVIHLNSSKVGGLGALGAFFYKLSTLNFKILTVFTVHGWGFKEDRPFWQKAIIWFLSWFSSLLQNKIIFICAADFNVAKRFIPRRKLALIFNGIGPIDFLPRDQARFFFGQKTGKELSADMVLSGTVAELNPNKGLTYLISAVDKIKSRINLKLSVVIIGGGEDKAKLKRQINSLGLKGTVFLLDFLPNASRYIKAFDLFVLPSLKEGLPYTIMEAMAAELPVVATRIGGIPDLIEHNKEGLLVNPKDPESIGRMLISLVDDPKLRYRLGKNAQKKIRERFTLLETVRKTTELYEKT